MSGKTFLIIFLLIGAVFLTACSKPDYTQFAKCVTESGAKVYGAFWCGNCKQQKAMLGDAFSEINYIECSLPDGQSQTEFCENENIQSYPTWEFAEGRIPGKMELSDLAQRTGCTLP